MCLLQKIMRPDKVDRFLFIKKHVFYMINLPKNSLRKRYYSNIYISPKENP